MRHAATATAGERVRRMRIAAKDIETTPMRREKRVWAWGTLPGDTGSLLEEAQEHGKTTLHLAVTYLNRFTDVGVAGGAVAEVRA